VALTLRDRIEGGIYGLLVGDALGVPYEFHGAASLPPRAQLEMTPPPGFDRAHGGVAPGTWSDDGAQALCLLASLLHADGLDLGDFARRLVNWMDHGYLAVDHLVFDVGAQTGRALSALRAGAPPEQAGPDGERANGNGSLMRVLPLALWHTGSDAALVRDAERQSLPTHGHRRARVCCALYCLWVRQALTSEGVGDPWTAAVASLRSIYDDAADREALAELEGLRPDEPPEGTGSGYVVDSLASARLAAGAGGYEAVVKHAISLGDDTDTTAAIAGGFAGVRDGAAAIPRRFLDALRGRELVDPLLEKLIERRERGPRG
jgi:ADP-ribosyl-[dinitrogen reductase] hydrolase